MHPLKSTLRLLLLVCLTQWIRATPKDYIDLLELPDNDEFLWGRHDNEIAFGKAHSPSNEYNSTGEGGGSDYLMRHILKKRQVIFQENKDYGECRTALGEVGRCRHPLYCRIPELKDDVWRLISQLCVIEQSSIGICCTQHTESRSSPQVISDVNNNGLEEARIVNKPEQRGCGLTTKQFPRITGGRPAEPDEWPWMAALIRPGLPYVWCGGALVTDRHVLTAGHCVHKFKMEDIFVRLGEYNTQMINETRARDFRIANMVIHIDYDPLTYENDIALLRLDRATLFNTYIWPVCMPPIGQSWEGQVGVVTGWGTQTFAGPHSEILMEVLLPIWKLADCRRAMVERIPDTVMCAGVREGGQDSCQGDSGGPLLVQLPNRRWVTVGIVSWGVRCGEANRPGMYTSVNHYMHWILQNSDI
ncbi:proclotting enzyme isoform X2 [Zeugodacus cucurbitae]|nr:proclotting enzyme isoform X2 [Zeugodacus cucurbitae]XP_011176680.1 proclotting enzyme isoform X2 [Zeugodacus cucurbitae]